MQKIILIIIISMILVTGCITGQENIKKSLKTPTTIDKTKISTTIQPQEKTVIKGNPVVLTDKKQIKQKSSSSSTTILDEKHLKPILAAIDSFTSDKELYHSHKKMTLKSTIKSDDEISGAWMKIYGLKQRGRTIYKLDKEMPINISEGKNDFTIEYTTPSCTACSGISSGDHQIRIEIYHLFNGTEKLLTNGSIMVKIYP